jgi:hypothetical protein
MLLNATDVLFLEKYRAWIKASLEYSINNAVPCDDDLVSIHWKSGSLIHFLGVDRFPYEDFISLKELIEICEDFATNSSIYEAWLNSVLQNVYALASGLNLQDGERLIKYFKTCQGIENIDDEYIECEAQSAIQDAREALYGY